MRTFLTKTLESVEKENAKLTLTPDVDVRELDLKDIETIDIAFEKYTDGRGYTYARVLRTELLYKGEIRAIGDVRSDQVRHMFQVGFDAVALAESQDVNVAIKNVKRFKHQYQPL